MKVAIIGAGLCGLLTADHLNRSGHDVTVFEQADTVGGRLATCQTHHGALDTGAQYFTARSAGFVEAVRQWCHDGLVARWQFGPHKLSPDGRAMDSADDTARYAGVGGMSRIAAALAQRVDVRLNAPAHALQQEGDHWRIATGTGPQQQAFDWVLLSLPLEQTRLLLPDELAQAWRFPAELHTPCWMVGLHTRGKVAPELQGLFGNGVVSWISRQSAKPGTPATTGGDNWVLHYAPDHSRRIGPAGGARIAAESRQWLQGLLGRDSEPVEIHRHYWHLANIRPDAPRPPCHLCADRKIGVIGAWCAGGKVEGAWQSAEACAANLAAI